MIKKMAGIAACAVVLQAGVVLAENRAETVTFAPYVGGYSFEGKQDIETGPVFGLRLGYNLTDNWALEGVIDYLNADRDGGGDVEMLRYGGDLVYNFMPKNSLVPYVAAGIGGLKFTSGTFPDQRLVANYGGGLKWFMTENVALRGDVRGLNYKYDGDLVTNVEYTLGLHIAVGAPKPAPKPVEEAVMPKAAPVIVPPADSDGDGIVDDLDLCPDTPKGVKVNGIGCPLDTDNDGVPDYLDKCPNTPKGVKVDGKGCPLDSDGDGVADYLDKCPATPRGDSVDQSGCTPKVVESATQKAVAAGTRISLKVQFDTGKSLIKKQYYTELKAVGDALNQDKTLKGTIEGYTDSVGNDKLNQQLSQRRANAVRDYIIKNFKVDAKRLTAKGYGEARPIADNATAAGRAQNRRIEALFE